jgi:hypothetical protein
VLNSTLLAKYSCHQTGKIRKKILARKLPASSTSKKTLPENQKSKGNIAIFKPQELEKLTCEAD